MERLFVSKSAALATTPATLAALAATGVTEGAVALFDNEGNVISKALTKKIPYFSLIVGGGAFSANSPYFKAIYDIDTNRFEYTKSVYAAGTKFKTEITIPTPVAGKDYTITLAKADTVLDQRYRWSASERAREGDTAAIIAKKLTTQLNNLGKNEGFGATVSAAKITIEATDYEPWNFVAGDALYGTTATVTKAMKPMNDDAALKALQLRTIGAEAIYGTSSEGYKLYTLPEFTNEGGWTIYTLTFYPQRNLRSGGNENVKTMVYLAVPTGSASIATLDTILASIVTPAAAASAAG